MLQADASMRAGEWKRSKYTGVELQEKTLGVLGLGRIGVLVAKRLAAFDMNVIATSRSRTPGSTEDGVTFVIQAGPEYRLLGQNSLDEMTLATPAIAGGSLFIRTASRLYRILINIARTRGVKEHRSIPFASVVSVVSVICPLRRADPGRSRPAAWPGR